VAHGRRGKPHLCGAFSRAAVNRFKFFKPVLPGTELRIETAKLTQAGTMACIEGTVSALGEKVASGELSVVSGQ